MDCKLNREDAQDETTLTIKIRDDQLARLLRLLFQEMGLNSSESIQLLAAGQNVLQAAEFHNFTQYLVTGTGATSLEIAGLPPLELSPAGMLAVPQPALVAAVTAPQGEER
jgi:hypothetical protein